MVWGNDPDRKPELGNKNVMKRCKELNRFLDDVRARLNYNQIVPNCKGKTTCQLCGVVPTFRVHVQQQIL